MNRFWTCITQPIAKFRWLRSEPHLDRKLAAIEAVERMEFSVLKDRNQRIIAKKNRARMLELAGRAQYTPLTFFTPLREGLSPTLGTE